MATAAEAGRRQRNPRGEGARLREEVIDAAMRILDRAPAAALSLRMVAREAGVAAPSLYRQFPDAAAMMGEIIEECWRQVGQAMQAAADEAADRPPLSRLQAQMGAFVRYAMLRPSRYQLLFALPLGWDHELVGPLRPAWSPVLETIERHVAEGGRLPTADAPTAALLTLSFAHGRIALAHLAPVRRSNRADDVERFIGATLEGLFGDALVRAPQLG